MTSLVFSDPSPADALTLLMCRLHMQSSLQHVQLWPVWQCLSLPPQLASFSDQTQPSLQLTAASSSQVLSRPSAVQPRHQQGRIHKHGRMGARARVEQPLRAILQRAARPRHSLQALQLLTTNRPWLI